ncbi:MAG: peptidoglycan DD-metalloendopeptidase family protein [Muribaculaceae bacterium]|nr:peptidoglycan DD-metalloendopeptidase family protein [Muribaculaceae bacterium]
MQKLINQIITSLAICAAPAFSAMADTQITPPAAHAQQHSDLIAGQLNIGNQIKVQDTEQFLGNLFPEEEEPEMDIYTEGWASQAVNCYANIDVPDEMLLDLRGFHMPTAPTYVTSPYGYRRRFRRMHKGIDLKVQIGDTIYAAFDGRVRIVRNQGRRKGYGLYVVIRHNNRMETVYGHLSKFLVQPDDYVKAGDPIALGGNTGRSTGPHLHFETRYMGYAINPAAIFDFANHTTHTDQYLFTKNTYMNARDYTPDAATYAQNDAKAKPAAKSGSATASTKGRSSYYTIRRGDTLSRIAAHHGTSVSALCRLNGLSTSSKLTIGKKIRLK